MYLICSVGYRLCTLTMLVTSKENHCPYYLPSSTSFSLLLGNRNFLLKVKIFRGYVPLQETQGFQLKTSPSLLLTRYREENSSVPSPLSSLSLCFSWIKNCMTGKIYTVSLNLQICEMGVGTSTCLPAVLWGEMQSDTDYQSPVNFPGKDFTDL